MAKLATLVVLLVLNFVFVVGCGSKNNPAPQAGSDAGTVAPAHDSNDIPLTEDQEQSLREGVTGYADAISKIKLYRDTIRDAMAAGDPTKAHQPLDELDVVLEHLPAVARDNNIPRTDWEAVNTSAQQLRDSFNKVHAQIDTGGKPDYQAVSTDIDNALGRLEAVSKGP